MPSASAAAAGAVGSVGAAGAAGGVGSAAGYAKCATAATCTPAHQDVIGTTTNGQLIGITGQPVMWDFYARDLNTLNTVKLVGDAFGSTRRVMLIVANLPLGAQLNPGLNGTALYTQEAVVWTPTAAATGMLQLILRDYDRCTITEQNPAVTCNALNQTPYDVLGTVAWTITAAAPAPPLPAAAATTAAPPSAPAPGGGLFGGLLGGVLGSLLSGNGGSGGSGASAGGTYTFAAQGQVYPDCKSNGGHGYGCDFACGTLWCAKDDPTYNTICTVTAGGGSSCTP